MSKLQSAPSSLKGHGVAPFWDSPVGEANASRSGADARADRTQALDGGFHVGVNAERVEVDADA